MEKSFTDITYPKTAHFILTSKYRTYFHKNNCFLFICCSDMSLSPIPIYCVYNKYKSHKLQSRQFTYRNYNKKNSFIFLI